LAAQVASAIAGANEASAQHMFVDSVEGDRMRSALVDVHTHYGICRVGDTVSGDGQTRARVRFECDRGRFDAWLQQDTPDGKLTGMRITRTPGEMCVP
jgi:hypothetical protein